MKIFVFAKPNSKLEQIRELDATHFEVRVKEPPKDGKANRAIIRALAIRFGVAPSRVELVSGFSSKQKIFHIL